MKSNPLGLSTAFVLLAFPPILSMCRGKFDVHEEVVIYEYYYCIALVSGLVSVMRVPTSLGYLGLLFLSGLAGFIRPTALGYGASTSIVTMITVFRSRIPRTVYIIGACSSGLGVALLLASNAVRFGSALEFGHRLNLTGLDMMYASRFDAPIYTEPLLPAATEVIGSLFFVSNLNDDAYRQGLVVGQSSTVRSRFFYTTTYDPATFLLIAALWICVLMSCFRRPTMSDARNDRMYFTLAAWSTLSFVALFGFTSYCRTSLYMLDFAASLSVAVAAGMLGLSAGTGAVFSCPEGNAGSMIVLIVAIWWCAEVTSALEVDFHQHRCYHRGKQWISFRTMRSNPCCYQLFISGRTIPRSQHIFRQRPLGYESEAAFSRAFKRFVGVSPGAVRSRTSAPRQRVETLERLATSITAG